MTPQQIREYLYNLGRIYVRAVTSHYPSEYLRDGGGVLDLAQRQRPYVRQATRSEWFNERVGPVDEEEVARRARHRWARHRRRIMERIAQGTDPETAVAEHMRSYRVRTYQTPDQAYQLQRSTLSIDDQGTFRSQFWEGEAASARRIGIARVRDRLAQMETIRQDPIAATAMMGDMAYQDATDPEFDWDDPTDEQLDHAMRTAETAHNVGEIVLPLAQRRAARRTGYGEDSGPVARDPINNPQAAERRAQRPVVQPPPPRAPAPPPRPAPSPATRGTAQPQRGGSSQTGASGGRRGSGSRGASGSAQRPRRRRPRESRPSRAVRDAQRQRSTSASARGREREARDAARARASQLASRQHRPSSPSPRSDPSAGQRHPEDADRAASPPREDGAAARRGPRDDAEPAQQPEDDIPLGRPLELDDLMRAAINLPRGQQGPARPRLAVMRAVDRALARARHSVRQLYQRITSEVGWHADLIDWIARGGASIVERFGGAARMQADSRRGYLSTIKGRIGEHLFNLQFRGAGRHLAQQLVRRLRLPAHARVQIRYADRAFTIGLGRRLEITDGLYIAEIRYPAIGDRPARQRIVILCAGEAKASSSALITSLRPSRRDGRARDPQQVRVRRRLDRFGLEMVIPGAISGRSPDSAVGAQRLRYSADDIEVHPDFTVFIGAPRGSGPGARAARARAREARIALRSSGIRAENLHLHHTEDDVTELAEHLLDAAIQAAQPGAATASQTSGGSNDP